MLVKACGLQDEENMREILALKPDYAGLIFVPHSKRYVGGFVPFNLPPATTKVTGVFQDAAAEEVISTVKRWKLNAVQLHGSESEEYCRQLKVQLPGIEILKAVGFSGDTLASFPSADFMLLDSPFGGGSGIQFDWGKIPSRVPGPKLFLSGGVKPTDAEKVLSLEAIYGVDINSHFEIRPGFKDVALVAEFIEQVKS